MSSGREEPRVPTAFAQLRLPIGPASKAVRYTLDQWRYLERYLLDRRLEIFNNRAERSIKPFVIDRKNFLFANTPRDAQASATIFSLIETSKENGLNPYEYLSFLLHTLPNTGGNAEDVLPDSAHIPQSCYSVNRREMECTANC